MRKTKNISDLGGIVILLAAAYFAGRHYKNHKYDSFAQVPGERSKPRCMDFTGARTASSKKKCLAQAFHYVPYMECAIKGSPEMAPACKVAGVKLFPSWQFGAEPPKEGVLSLEALSDKTGCSLP